MANAISTASIIGATLMLSRMLLLLFAARPDNVGVQVVLWLSQWLYLPFGWLDAGQPVFGARFERGALLAALICIVITWRLNRAPTPPA
ncbi:MAG: hypothetical protein DWI30_08165 [Chloroflexi bacterium]|nr:MAG: hypothetical protein DWI30_08165 [Chloroflexota bacterium]